MRHTHKVLVWRSYSRVSPQTCSMNNIELKSLQHKSRFVLSHKMTSAWLTALRTKKSGLSPSQRFPFLCAVLCCCRCQGAKKKKGAADLLLCRAERSGLSLITKDQLCQPRAPLIIIVASSNSGTNLELRQLQSATVLVYHTWYEKSRYKHASMLNSEKKRYKIIE